MEKTFAAIVLLMCVALLVRLGLGARRRQRLDAGLRRGALICRLVLLRIWHVLRYRRAAANEAEAAIRRARERGQHKDDNVIRPESFKSNKKPRKPH
jgi:hypothetical protein